MKKPNRNWKGRFAIRVALTFFSIGILSSPGSVSGEPINRIGYHIAYSSNKYSIEYTDGGTQELKSSGLGLGIDAQFLATEIFTLNPFLMVSIENNDVAGLKFFNVIGGLQARYWTGRIFIGGNLSYNMTVISDGNTTSYVGPGIGMNGGWENQNGYFISLRVDKSFHPAEQIGFRIHLGFRWL